ncbi:Rossmann-fold NAD(P)-binding domain-containing protein [Actinoallomurus soli]|uniref:hypothetical protein n=1 Tax=Actinoallomurus soli TaxID=2952535 RepID=UPI0020925B32|nr:hypothetical protein [Actinoallomurus soli]MCO5968446.1 hypothetical protein [Actinoallomurus soli]
MDALEWEIRPFAGISGFGVDVRFGARRDEVAADFAKRFGDDLGEVRPFRKAAWDVGICDHYVAGDLIAFFDDQDRLYYLEPGSRAPVGFDGIALTGRPYDDVIAELTAHGLEVPGGDDGHRVPEAGFALTRNGDGEVGSVGVFAADPGDEPAMSDEPEVAPITEHRLVSGRGTETVRLGQSRQELRALLGPALQSVPPYGGTAQDWYFDHGLILTFDEDSRLTTLVIGYVGVSGTAWFEDVQLLGRGYAEVTADLAARGVRVEQEVLGGRVPEHGFSLSLLGLQNPAMPIAAVVFRADPTSG